MNDIPNPPKDKEAKAAEQLRLYLASSIRSQKVRLYIAPDIHPQTLLLRLLLLGGFVALFCVPILTVVDVPISRWFAAEHRPSEISQAIELAESYSHGVGVLFIIIGIFTLAPDQRWYLPRLGTMAFGAAAIATVVKMFILRSRPSQLNLGAISENAAWHWSFDWKLEHIATFDAGTRAFPSGGTATAIALTVGLCMLFPRGKYLFMTIALFSMIQRLHTGSHFTSDVLGGLASGLFWSYICLHPKLLGVLFEQMEPPRLGHGIHKTSNPRVAA